MLQIQQQIAPLATDLAARNFNFETEADGIIDFSESNPFGDAT